jgi:hypothetical protein
MDIVVDNDEDADASETDVIAETSRITCKCLSGCCSPRSERDITDDRGDNAHIE